MWTILEYMYKDYARAFLQPEGNYQTRCFPWQHTALEYHNNIVSNINWS